MELHLKRVHKDKDRTIGTLYIDTKLFCFNLENPKQDIKIPGETRINSGRYRILLRNEGAMNEKYKKRFPEFHRGMLWLQNVDNFQWIYIHIGNYPKDTDGCILVGYGVSEKLHMIKGSKNAYSNLYKKIINVIDREYVYITVEDEEGGLKC